MRLALLRHGRACPAHDGGEVVPDKPGHDGGEAASKRRRPRSRYARAPARPFAARIVSHTRSGVAGISIVSTPHRDSASITALITVGRPRVVPDSPMPLTPSGLVLHGTSSRLASNPGMLSARGIA